MADTVFGQSPLLSEGERVALSDIRLDPVKVPANRYLFHEHEKPHLLYFLLDGWACQSRTLKDGGRHLPALMVPGDLCNLDSLSFPRPGYGVQALTAGTILTLPRERAVALADTNAGIGRTFMWMALAERSMLNQHVTCLGRFSAQRRLAHLICELSVRLGWNPGQSAFSFDMHLTQEHLADTLGLTSVHVNRMMQSLRAEGLIACQRRSVTIPAMERLFEFAQFDGDYLRRWPAIPMASATSFPRLELDFVHRAIKSRVALAKISAPETYVD